MNNVVSTTQIRLGSSALAIAGVLFVLYPALRPFSDETSLQGAAAFASSNWLLAHILAMIAFTLLLPGLLSFFLSLQKTVVAPLGYWALVLGMVGIGLTLPFYGGEAFGLYAIGQAALQQQDADLLNIAAVVRAGTGLGIFLIGLIVLAVSAILVAIMVWKSGTYATWSGVPLAVGIALYIPQFFFAQPIRVAHGILVAIGCLWLAVELWRHGK
jgi:hypothetical protein